LHGAHRKTTIVNVVWSVISHPAHNATIHLWTPPKSPNCFPPSSRERSLGIRNSKLYLRISICWCTGMPASISHPFVPLNKSSPVTSANPSSPPASSSLHKAVILSEALLILPSEGSGRAPARNRHQAIAMKREASILVYGKDRSIAWQSLSISSTSAPAPASPDFR